MPPLEDRIARTGFRDAQYGGADTGYDAGGSWVAWLLGRYGSSRFMAFTDWTTSDTCVSRTEAVYGMSFSALEHAWLGHVAHEFGMPSLYFSSPGR
jgi:hypothetical protein